MARIAWTFMIAPRPSSLHPPRRGALALPGCAVRARSRPRNRRRVPVAKEPDEDVLERALLRVQVLEVDPVLPEPPEQLGDSGRLAPRVERIDEPGSVGGELEPQRRELGRHARERLSELEQKLLLPELLHQSDLFLNQA